MTRTTDTESRAFVLGLDGVPWRLLRQWAADGELEHFAELFAAGAAGPLESTTPATTPLAWPSIATGTRPDRHGIYGFRRPAADYTQRVYTAEDLARPPLWELLSPAVVGNVPMTYPASAIDGAMVTGMMTPGVGDGFAHPPDLREEIDARIPDYEVGLRWNDYGGATDEFLADLQSLVARRRELMRLLLERADWRLCFFVYTAPDRLQHHVWEEDVLLEHYRTLDDILGEVMERVADRDATLYVVSDHGFGPISKHVAVNRLLADEGLLVQCDPAGVSGLLATLGVTRDSVESAVETLGIDLSTLVGHLPPSLRETIATQVPGNHALYDMDAEETAAFVHELGAVYVNDDRFAGGSVAPERVPAVKRRLVSLLSGLTDPETGESVLAVKDGEELYPTDPNSPDLVVEAADGYEITPGLPEEVFADAGTEAASHRREGIFLAWGPDVEAGATPADATVFDVAPTVLHGAGEPVPTKTDGRVLTEIFAPDSAPARAEPRTRVYDRDESAGAGDRGPDGADGTDESDEAFDDVEDRLRGLGYLD